MYDVTTAKLFLLDMDGTFYLDDTLLPGALSFWHCAAPLTVVCVFNEQFLQKQKHYLAKLTRAERGRSRT